jgi:hypothetical protein
MEVASAPTVAASFANSPGQMPTRPDVQVWWVVEIPMNEGTSPKQAGIDFGWAARTITAT